jgi:hypothetical protein
MMTKQGAEMSKAQHRVLVTRPKILSLGGGLDSFALLVEAIRRNEIRKVGLDAKDADHPEADELLAEGCELPDVVVMCDVGAPGDPGEWPSTYRHVDEVVRPLCAKHGIPFVMITGDMYPVRGERSLWAYYEKTNTLPGRMSRLCTNAAKVERFAKWADANYPDQEIEVWVGFEAGEENRAANDPHGASAVKKPRPGKCVRINRFPLIEWGLCRCRCEALVRAAGFPVPRKSACVFCCFNKVGDFQTLAVELPETFERVAAHEERAKLTKSGYKLRYFQVSQVRVGLPLAEAVRRPYTRQQKGCSVCGAAVAATKATGCDYVSEAAS